MNPVQPQPPSRPLVPAEATADTTASAASWSSRPERSNLPTLRAIAWIATTCGRRLSRAVLLPISLYFLLFSPAPRRHVRRYLSRAIGPGAGWVDTLRLMHAFAATVLDRIYFLRGRFDLFDVSVRGAAPVEAAALSGQGAFLVGAHVGSFEALAACRYQSDRPQLLRVGMLMFPDNARQINAVLDAIAVPELRPQVIALGRPGSMLALRDWLDSGGMAGMLADRTLPGQDEAGGSRDSRVEVPFLGVPAMFNDGPFRLAELLRRQVFFMAGVYLGGACYEIVFEPLADFSERLRDPAERERRLRAAVERYVARLEAICRAHPYNWFNFHDFWLEDAP